MSENHTLFKWSAQSSIKEATERLSDDKNYVGAGTLEVGG
jgi:hypothetical protein